MIEVTAAILLKNNRVLLARRRPGKDLEGFWELPGGKIEDGEDPATCLQRELNEELGIDSKVGDHLLDSEYSYDHITICLKAYFTEHLSGEIKPVDHDKIEWVAINKLLSYQLAPADIPIVKKVQEVYGNQ